MEWTTLDYSTTVGDQSANSSSGSGGRNEGLARAEVAVQAALFALAVGGNSLVLVVLLAVKRRKLNRMNVMMAHLSAADLCVAFFTTLPQLIWDVTGGTFHGGDVLCRLVTTLQMLAMYASSYVMVTTTIDRFLVICYPLSLHRWTRRRMMLLVGLAWALSLLFSAPQIFIFSHGPLPNAPATHSCYARFVPAWTEKLYSTFIFLAIYVVPLLIITAAYSRICYVVWSSSRQRHLSESSSTSTNNGRLLNSLHDHSSKGQGGGGGRMAKAKVKTIKLTLTVILCYIVCWGPFFIMQMWSVFDNQAPHQSTAMVIILLLPGLNSCANPWIYLVFLDKLPAFLSACCRKHNAKSCYRNTYTSHTEFTRLDQLRPSRKTSQRADKAVKS